MVRSLTDLCIIEVCSRGKSNLLAKLILSLPASATPSSKHSSELYGKLFERVVTLHRLYKLSFSPVEYWLVLLPENSKSLDLSGTNASLALPNINKLNLSCIVHLDLSNTLIGGDGIQFICRHMAAVKVLFLSGCHNVNDKDIAPLATLPQVNFSNLRNSY